ncbi:winged helix-turn-helix domain-containing protein [Aquamicrobium lusatiense]|uniref:winged helix-turn-helix domain-containing protein n=1 Tax=Aquamicrobium lusatiense TaxID=89772 RepID=UPI002456807D|nr:winged helix family transcriptional regulator [Aquamicrobium lusatiense]MDH4992383.1 winged helix-turn-helix domain-containing protein [Aquamicrobium lusatiense]
MQPVRYADLLFQPDMLSARRDDGTVLRLTRQERALLLRLVRQPHRLVIRAQLLDGLGDLAGDLNERNIDYLVNRLRKRLGDNARAPRFIATQYGEGYVWIADPVLQDKVSAFVLIGPVFGLGDQSERLLPVLHDLAGRVESALGNDRAVLCLPDWRHDPKGNDDIAFALEASLLVEDETIHVAAMLREGRGFAPIAPFRVTLPEPDDRTVELAAAAKAICQAIWSHAALPGNELMKPAQPPLHLRLHDAAMLLTGSPVSWRENALRLEQEHANNPGDAVLSVMLALNRYAQLLQAPVTPGEEPVDDDTWKAIEDEMERLALEALPKAQGNPIVLFGIAKVLRFIDRGYLQLAQRLTDEAFQTSTAFATAFAMKGQVAASLGEIDRALELYERAIELAEPGSQFHIYLLVLKATSLLAADRRGDVEQVTTELYALDPSIRIKLGLFFVSPNARLLPPAIQSVMAALSPERARAALLQLYRVSARQFQHGRHRKNVLAGAAVHLVRQHGPDVLPPDVKTYFPDLARQASR